MSLPNDYSRCLNKKCKSRTTCARFLQGKRDKDGYFWYADFKEVDGICSDYIEEVKK